MWDEAWAGSKDEDDDGTASTQVINVSDRREVQLLCEALNCRTTDLFIAIATVGDRVSEIRRFIARTFGQSRFARDGEASTCELPPPWPIRWMH